MRVHSILALLAVVALSGCVTNGDDDDDDDQVSDDGSSDDGSTDDGSADDGGTDDGSTDDGGDDGTSGVDPRSGAWRYGEYAPNRNDCNLPNTYGNGGGGFLLANHGDGTFTVTPGDGTDPFDCTLDGADFSCPDRATEEEEVDPQYDATLIGQARADGTFADPENGSGTQTADVQCDGSDCGLLELATGVQFPCTFAVDFDIDWRSRN